MALFSLQICLDPYCCINFEDLFRGSETEKLLLYSRRPQTVTVMIDI